MNNLTAKERKIFNNLSRVQSPSVSLGEKIQAMINRINSGLPGVEGSPVNAAASGAVLEISGVVVHGETLVIINPFVDGADIYEFLATAAQLPTDMTNIPVDIEASTTKSTGTLTIDTQPTSGNTMTIGEKVYTFVPDGTNNADGEISIGTSLATAQAAIVAAINGTDGVNIPHPLVNAADFESDDCVLTALIGGVAGDVIDTTETFTAVTNIFAAAVLGGGADCSAADAATALVVAITAYDTQGVVAADGAGDTVTLTAVIPGSAGNDIAIATTMANGVFTDDVTELAGGVDGTVADAMTIMFDGSFIYFAIDVNTVTDTNWRRISLGSAY